MRRLGLRWVFVKRMWIQEKDHEVEEEDETASLCMATIRPSHQGVSDVGELDISSTGDRRVCSRSLRRDDKLVFLQLCPDKKQLAHLPVSSESHHNLIPVHAHGENSCREASHAHCDSIASMSQHSSLVSTASNPAELFFTQ